MTNTTTTQLTPATFVAKVRDLDSALTEWHNGNNRRPSIVLDVTDLEPVRFPWLDEAYCR